MKGLAKLRESEEGRAQLRGMEDEQIADLIENDVLAALPAFGTVFNLLQEAASRLRRANEGARLDGIATCIRCHELTSVPTRHEIYCSQRDTEEVEVPNIKR